MSSSDGAGHSLRRHYPLKSPKKIKKGDDRGNKSPSLSVHNKNFYIASYPVVLLFNIVRALLYQIFVLLKTLFRAGTYLAQTRTETNVGATTVVITELENCGGGGNSGSGGSVGKGTSSGLGQVEEGANTQDEVCVPLMGTNGEMPPKVTTNPGPGDPLLAKQKHHHRKAFEYISKALKIDEENE
ncbi:hypothetical protein SK128_021216, partial [Halocaridina rubra]